MKTEAQIKEARDIMEHYGKKHPDVRTAAMMLSIRDTLDWVLDQPTRCPIDRTIAEHHKR